MKKGRSKTEKIDNDFGLDSDLDLGGFDFDFNPPKDDRKPSIKVASGIFKGMKDTVRDTAFLKKMLKNSVPEGFGKTIDLNDRVTEGIRSLYDESAKEIKPVVKDFKKFATKLIPKESTMMPKAVVDMLKRWDAESKESKVISRSNQREDLLASTLAEAFKQQFIEGQKDKALAAGEDRLKQGLELAKHRDIFGVLNQSNQHLSRLSQYQTTVNLQFQKKTLEVNYRQLFALQDLVESSNKQLALQVSTLADIKKNTALPDFVKYKDKEIMQDVLKRKFWENSGKGLFDSKANNIAGIINTVRDKALLSIKEAANSFRMAMMAGDQVGTLTSGGGPDKYGMGGEIAGSFAMDELGQLGAEWAKKKLSKHKKINALSLKAGHFAENLPRKLTDWKKSNQYVFDDSMKGNFMKMLQGLLPSIGPDTQLKGPTSYKDLESPHYITKRTDRSINEVIPGYLARIWREIQVLRTGNTNIELTPFDHVTGKYTSKSKLLQTTFDTIVPKKEIERTNYQLDKIMQDLEATNLPKPVQDSIKKKILQNSTRGREAKIENLGRESRGEDAAGQEAAQFFRTFFKNADQEKINSFSGKHNALSNYFADPRATVENMINLGRSDALREMGIIDKTGTTLNLDTILDFHLGKKPSLNTGKHKVRKNYGSKSGTSSFSTATPTSANQSTINTILNAAGASPAPQSGTSVLPMSSSPFAGPSNAVNNAINNVSAVANEATGDVVLEGNESIPIMTAAKIKMGYYFDKWTKEPITHPNQINGGVVDSQGQTVISEEDIPNLRVWYVTQQRFGPIRFIGKVAMSILKGLYKFQKNVALPWTKFNIKVMKSVGQFGVNVAKLSMGYGPLSVKDVYVKGETEPRMYAARIKAGQYRSRVTGEIIYHQHDINGEIEDLQGNVVLTEEDLPNLQIYSSILKMLNPLKLVAKVGKVTTSIAKFGIKQGAKATKVILQTLGKASSKVASSVWRTIAKPVDVFVSGSTTVRLSAVNFKEGRYYSAKTGKTIWMPSEIDGPVMDREDNSQKLSDEDIEKGITDVQGRPIKTTLAGKLLKGFKAVMKMMSYKTNLPMALSEKTTASVLKDKNSTTADKTIALLTEIKNALTKKKKVLGDTDGDGVREGSWQDILTRAKSNKAAKKANEKAAKDSGTKTSNAEGGLISGVIGALGSIGGLITGIKDLFSLGKGAAALATTGATAVSAATTATTVLAGSTAIAATGGLMGTLGAGIVAAGGALLTFLSSPIVLGAAAVGLAGYGIYKGYKYFTRDNLNPLLSIRYTQYGFKIENTKYVHQVVSLEEFLSKNVSVGNSGAKLDEKNLDIKKLLDVFGIDSDDSPKMEAFFKWYQKRFKPVYLTHVTACKALTEGYELSNVDNLSSEDKKAYIDAIKFPDGPYSISTLPVSDYKEGASTSKDVQNIITWAMKALKLDESKGSKSLGMPTANATTVATTTTLPNGITINPNDREENPASVNKGSGYSASGDVSNSLMTYRGNLNALDAVRYKAYGLVEMDPDKIRAIKLLEQEILKDIKFTGRATATWDGLPSVILNHLLGSFGIRTVFDSEASDWRSWLKKRFLPVYLAYLSAYFNYTGKKEISLGNSVLKPQEQLDTARILAGVSGIWDKTDSPWPNYKLNTDSSSIKENIEFLNSVAKDIKLQQDKKQLPETTSKATASPPKQESALAGSNLNSPVSLDGESKPASATATVTSTITGSNGANVDSAGGPIFDGRGGPAAIVFNRNVDITRVNPQFLKLFYGMAEEYNKLTGKKISVNSGFRTFAEQQRLYNDNPRKAAPPGGSLHEFGLAMDVDSATLDELDKLGLMRKYGLTRPVGGEPWHMEPAGIQTNIDKYKRDSDAASAAIKDAAFKGGGGFGSIKDSIKGARNRDLAVKLLLADVKPTIQNKSDSDTLPTGQGVMPEPTTGSSVQPTDTIQSTVSTPPPKKSGGFFSNIKNMFSSEDKPAATKSSIYGSSPMTGSSGIPESPASKLPAAVVNGDVKTSITSAAKMVGVDPNLALGVVAVESGFKATAANSNSSAKGLYQFTNTTWKETVSKHGSKYGITPDNSSPNDTGQASLMGAHLIKDSMSQLKGRINRDVGVVESYFAHLLGVGGATKLLNALDQYPNAIGAQMLPQAASSNRDIFYNANTPRTISEIYAFVKDRITKKAASYGITLPSMPGGYMSSVAQNSDNRSTSSSPSSDDGATIPVKQQSEVSKTISAISRSPMSDAYGFNSRSGNGAQAAVTASGTQNLISADLMKNTENILSSSLDTQKEMLSVLKDIFGIMSTNKPKENKVPGNEPYTIPKVPVPMRKSMV